jgi:hypothetical protein
MFYQADILSPADCATNLAAKSAAISRVSLADKIVLFVAA